MYRRTKINGALMLAFGSVLACGASVALAQQQLDRVEITGSSIKRINAETALPVQTITADQIKKSGYTSVTDLIQNLSSMQGFTTNSQSVNGGGGGTSTASLHSIGQAYTLVLLNGRRLAPFNTGTTVNLNTIPLAAIERVEVLLDGASALYGADAIAGVVNFITKKDSTDGAITLSANLPQHAGAKSSNAALSKGFGDLDKDKFNVFLAASFDKQDELNAEQRDFSKTGFIPFSDKGRNLTTFLSSSNSIPGNVILTDSTGAVDANGDRIGANDAFYSPYYLANGKCPAKSVYRGGICRFDFSSTVQAIPSSERASLYGAGRLKLSDSFTVFSELAYSDYKMIASFAPSAQPGIFLTQALVDKYVTPNLAKLGIAPGTFYGVGDPSFQGPQMNLRTYDAGRRTDEFRTKTTHFVVGGEGTVSDIDYTGYYTHSENKFTDSVTNGYLSNNAFNTIVASGAFDPLAATIGQSVSVLAPAVLHQVFDETKSTLDIVHGQASKPLMKLSGGDMQIAVGGDYGRQRFTDSPSAIAQGANALQPNYTDTPIGGSSGSLPFNSKRNNKGVFAELVAPVMKGLELSAAVRYDSVSAVTNTQNFDAAGNPAANATQGKSASATTYKLSARYQPVQDVLLRASYGTGFKAPTLENITQPVQAFGNTSFHDCPPGLAAALAAFCKSQPYEYNIRQGGNPSTGATALEPEKSKQWTLGVRFEPTPALTLGVDLWNVNLKQRIDTVPEDVAFSNGVTYGSSFSVLPDPVTGAPTLTYTRAPQNLGKARYQGLDFDAVGRAQTPIGRLTTKGTFTYMIKSEYEVLGLPGYQSSLGKIGPDTEAVFRWLLNVSTSLETGAFTNTLTALVKPGYLDSVATTASGPEVRVVNADGTIGARAAVTRRVASYVLLDWQTKYAVRKDIDVTVGIKNLLDHNPPLSIQDGAGTGNVRGYDARYTDPIGRAFYVSGSYKF